MPVSLLQPMALLALAALLVPLLIHLARRNTEQPLMFTALRWLQSQLLAHGGEFFADGRLTIADLKVFVDVRGLNSGRLDHIPTDLVEKVAPLLNTHMQRIAQTPAVAQYYSKFGVK